MHKSLINQHHSTVWCIPVHLVGLFVCERLLPTHQEQILGSRAHTGWKSDAAISESAKKKKDKHIMLIDCLDKFKQQLNSILCCFVYKQQQTFVKLWTIMVWYPGPLHRIVKVQAFRREAEPARIDGFHLLAMNRELIGMIKVSSKQII